MAKARRDVAALEGDSDNEIETIDGQMPSKSSLRPARVESKAATLAVVTKRPD